MKIDKLWAQSLSFSMSGPLALWFIDFYPPLYADSSFLFNAVITLTISSVGCIVILVGKHGIDSIQKKAKHWLYFGLILLILYIILYQIYVVHIIQTQLDQTIAIRFICGFEYLEHINTLGKTNTELIKEYGDPNNVWTNSSIVIISLLFMLTYNGAFFSLSRGYAMILKAKNT